MALKSVSPLADHQGMASHTVESTAALLVEAGLPPVFTGTTRFGGAHYFAVRTHAAKAAFLLRRESLTATVRRAPNGPAAFAVEVR